MDTRIGDLRRSILDRIGLVPLPKTKELVYPVHLPDLFHKTTKMKELEYKYNIKIEKVLFKGSLNDTVKILHYDIDRSTVSKWRKYIRSKLVKIKGLK